MSIFDVCKPLIGVVHLPPLPGSPGYNKQKYPSRLGRKWSFEEIIEYAIQEAKKYETAGFDAIIVENYGDKPYSQRVSVGQAIAISIIAKEINRETTIPIGISLLRNSGYEAVYAAKLSNASFLRINNLCEVRVSPEGLLFPAALDVAKALSELNIYDALDQGTLAVLADVNVKHSWPFTPNSPTISEVTKECIERTGFKLGAIVVTGTRTGVPPSEDAIKEISNLLEGKDVKVIIGSGVTPENLPKYWRISDGFIIGTWVKVGRITENLVSLDSAKRIVALAKRYREVWPCTRT